MVVLIDNYDSFTYNLKDALVSLGAGAVSVVRNDKATIAELEAMRPTSLVVSPGPGDPEAAGISLAAIRHFAGKIPILGVCLGHQAIGAAFGARIRRASRIVHGETDRVRHDGKGVFRRIARDASFTRYHSLAIDPDSLPACLEVSATSADGEIMGVRHRDAPIEGVQFHPESIASEEGRRLLANFLSYRREAFPYASLLAGVVSGAGLGQAGAEAFAEEMADGMLSDAEIAAMLAALAAKGESAEEIAGLARVLRRRSGLAGAPLRALDTCGTGGDHAGTWNISSMAALLAASLGVPVAKHGNRSVSSRSGSSDFFAALGVRLCADRPGAERELAEHGFAFLHAPSFHGSMRHAANARSSIGIPTIMNLVGPLANPLGVDSQVIGVRDRRLLAPMARAAGLLGVRSVLTVHGGGGMDELSPVEESRVFELRDGEERFYSVSPAELGIPPCDPAGLLGGSPADNALAARRLFAGQGAPEALRHAVALNAGAGLYAFGASRGIKEAYITALEALDSGVAGRFLDAVAAPEGEAVHG